MNIFRAMIAACDGCTVYQDIYDEGEEPVTMCMINGVFSWELSTAPVSVTPDMIKSKWTVARKWRNATEAKAMQALADGYIVRTQDDNGPFVVVLNDGVVCNQETDLSVPMKIDRQWQVLR